MTRFIYTICVSTFALCSLAQAAPPEARLPEKHRAFFKAHCLDCHDSETQEGKVDLQTLPFRITTIEQAELWQKVLNALNSGEMPPEVSEQPGNQEKTEFLDDLAQTMVSARRVLSMTSPASCPQAASISSPRVLRTVTITPLLCKISRKRLIREFEERL